VVLHPFARRHGRNEPQWIGHLEALLNAGDERELFLALLDAEPDAQIAVDDLMQISGVDVGAIRAALRTAGDVVGLPDAQDATVYASRHCWQELRRRVLEALAALHRATPSAPGVDMESLRTQALPNLSAAHYRAVVDALVAQAALCRDGSLLRLPQHDATPSQAQAAVAQRAAELLSAAGMTPPDLKQIEAMLQIGAPQVRAVLQQLERAGRVAKVAEGMYFAAEPLDRARELMRQHIAQHGSITAAAFRDLLGASRKFSIALLDYFDRTGFTMRVGDLRKLRR
jgi:selenocysteine-specific elongation factor